MSLFISHHGTPILSFGDWERLAQPKGKNAQWRKLRSAMECARAWTVPSPQVPADITRILHSHPDLADCQIHTVMPEERIPFDRLGEPRNADVAAIARDRTGTVAITIEAKADEEFAQTIAGIGRYADARAREGKATNAPERLASLVAALLPGSPAEHDIEKLRYQLFTGGAGSLAFAASLQATRAVFIVHEFESTATDPKKLARNDSDFTAFVSRLAPNLAHGLHEGLLVGPVKVPGGLTFPSPADLYLGKVRTTLR